MARIVFELDEDEAGVVYRALVEQFKQWVFSRIETDSAIDEESDRMLCIAEALTKRLEYAMQDTESSQRIINDAIDGPDIV